MVLVITFFCRQTFSFVSAKNKRTKEQVNAPKVQIPRIERHLNNTLSLPTTYLIKIEGSRYVTELLHWKLITVIWWLKINYEQQERCGFPHSTIAHQSRFSKTHSRRDLTTLTCCSSWAPTPMLATTLCSHQGPRYDLWKRPFWRSSNKKLKALKCWTLAEIAWSFNIIDNYFSVT